MCCRNDIKNSKIFAFFEIKPLYKTGYVLKIFGILYPWTWKKNIYVSLEKSSEPNYKLNENRRSD